MVTDEITITLAAFFTSLVLIAVFAITLWRVFLHFWDAYNGWYQQRKTDKMVEQWEKAKETLRISQD